MTDDSASSWSLRDGTILNGIAIMVLVCAVSVNTAKAQSLTFPTLVGVEEAREGNALAGYARLLALEPEYTASAQLAEIFLQVRLMNEEFMGVPDAGVRAMSRVAQLRRTFPPGEAAIPRGHTAENALDVIAREAALTRVVIWGEEHHLPQTRSLYEPMLRRLWTLGYRYLAAEAFSDSVMAPTFRFASFASGVYLRDPVYANAVRVAVDMGYRLIAYDEAGVAPSGDAGFRDRRQAEKLKMRIFDADSLAKVIIFAGRAHVSEATSSDGWTPMASVLKRITGIDPFTIFAVRMGERLTSEEEDPQYRYATAHGLVTVPTIFVDSTTRRTLGDASFDAYVFWPRTTLIGGRPDWLERVLGRRRLAIPPALGAGKGLRLVQAYRPTEPTTAIPVDQVLLDDASILRDLMLPMGTYVLRTIDPTGRVLAKASVSVQ
ncbi:MAG: hypothetical protein ABI625_14685 [bacterium]